MTSKKSHEVQVLSNIAAAVQKISKTSHIVDIGDGKGYLSSMLALNYKIPVLGVDASEINTNSAVDRVEKLSKVWNSLTTGEKSKKTSKDLYRQITKYVDEKIDFKDVVETVFLEKPTDISLVGLHTCGNLATASLRIFCARPEIKTICNVGCCYHFIAEQFEQNIKHVIPNKNKTSDFGFPMSQFLIDRQFVIGRSARMMAAQSVDRIFYNKELPSKTIFYRALLQIYMKINHPDVIIKDVGRFRKPASDFVDYTRKALKRLKLELDLSDEVLHEFYKEYECRCDELNVFYLIRCLLAPVIENLILLDRILFLHENGYENSFLVQLFDPVISPRCYSIIAFK
ncbi:unnamed protein product [Brassicogethes aeneus]|uniref:Methyltransferase domain-containing protein n=1 Tax=Brassicogethes aeneus TaxID=1431903 RepID=A0A9P0FGX7_BRAAE|nr:unnamed protein product [Brassicogethes aeneus]